MVTLRGLLNYDRKRIRPVAGLMPVRALTFAWCREMAVSALSGDMLKSRKVKAASFGRRILHDPEFPVILVFTPKAGCTSLTKWFLFQVGKLEEATAYHTWIHRYRMNVLCRQENYRQDGTRMIRRRKKPVVKLVRDPYSRAVSSFLSTLNNAHGRTPKSWAHELVVAARTRAGKPVDGGTALSFRDFAGFIAANGTGQGQINGHVARQHIDGEEQLVGRIIKLERFADDIRQLESEYGLAASPLDLITRSQHHRSASQDGATAPVWSPDTEIPTEQVRQFRKSGVPSYGALYDEETRRLVREGFAADFEAYGYE
jgi:hypothetical protein